MARSEFASRLIFPNLAYPPLPRVWWGERRNGVWPCVGVGTVGAPVVYFTGLVEPTHRCCVACVFGTGGGRRQIWKPSYTP